MGEGLAVALFVLSAACGVAGYVVYIRGITRAMLLPNRWSWLIWTASTTLEVATFQGVSGNLLTTAVFAFSVGACFVVTAAIWAKGRWGMPVVSEFLCVVACAIAVWLMAVGTEAWWAHLVMIAAVPISFLPTFRSAFVNPYSEDTSAWVYWTIGDLFALAYIFGRMQSWHELPYPTIEALSHGVVWLMVGFGLRGGPSRIGLALSLLVRASAIASLSLFAVALAALFLAAPHRPEAWLLLVLLPAATALLTRSIARPQVAAGTHSEHVVLGTSHLGKAVFATRKIERGEWILDFSGERRSDEHGADTDHVMQVGLNEFLGPSGELDDFVNHSCEPNCGVRFSGDSIFLIAIRQILPGDEITWDYSTTAHGGSLRMRCDCRSENCRRLVTQFADLPFRIQRRYIRLGVVAPYIMDALRSSPRFSA